MTQTVQRAASAGGSNSEQQLREEKVEDLSSDFWNVATTASPQMERVRTLQLPVPVRAGHGGLDIPGTIFTETDLEEQTRRALEEKSMTPDWIVKHDGTGSSTPVHKPARRFCLVLSDLNLQPVAHAAVIAFLATRDALHGAHCGQDAGSTSSKALLFIFLCLTLLLLSAVQLRSLQSDRACAPPRLLVAVLHAGISMSGAVHRLSFEDCTTVSHGSEEDSLTMALGILQLVTCQLYPTTAVANLVASAVSTAALLLFQLHWLQAMDVKFGWENHLLLILLAAVCVMSMPPRRHARSSRCRGLLGELLLLRSGPGVRLTQAEQALRDTEAQVLHDAFLPVFSLKEEANRSSANSPKVGTYLSHIVNMLIAATQKVKDLTELHEPARQVLVDALTIISGELSSTSSLNRIPDAALANSSAAMINYVNTVLQRPQLPVSAELPVQPVLNTMNTMNTMESESGTGSGRTRRSNTCASAASSITAEERSSCYSEIVGNMAAMLNPARVRRRTGSSGTMTSTQFDQLMVNVGFDLGTWHAKLFDLFDSSGKQPIVVLGRQAVRVHADALGVDLIKVATFFDAIEERYSADAPYHNSLHGADVMNSLLYFLRLPDDSIQGIDHLEQLTALLVACAHDVGHPGKANRYHIVCQSPIAQLFNDQSVLENMHCAIMFAVLKVEACNVLDGMDAQSQAVFRNLAVEMILNTDLAKHVKALSQFRQEFFDGSQSSSANGSSTRALTPAQRKDVLTFLLKCADVGGSAKPFNLHAQWTMRICTEFYAQGDAERALGLACSPFCDRNNTSLRECQTGFFDFVAAPMFAALGDFLSSPRLKFEVLAQLDENRAFWKAFEDEDVDHNNTMAYIPKLQYEFLRRGQSTANSLKSRSRGKAQTPGKIVRVAKTFSGSSPTPSSPEAST